MSIVCDKCGSDNVRSKTITSKKGNKCIIYECQDGCMNGRYPYSFFPPREQKPQSQSSNIDVIPILMEIRDLLKQIVNKKEIVGNNPPF